MIVDPNEKIAAWMRELFEARIYFTLNSVKCDSPIEDILLRAVLAVVDAYGFKISKINANKHTKRESPQEAISRFIEGGSDPLAYEVQAPIEKFTADFLFITAFNETKNLVVECDGHEFHERTKTQAAHDRSRDRRMQELGYTVFRFTGSEIYRDPMKCACQIGDWMWG